MSIKERISEKGVKSYRVMIRKRGQEIMKTFSAKEDAELFEYYRTKLVENMANFDVDVKDRVRLIDVIDLKIRRLKDERSCGELELSCKRVLEHMKAHTFLCELTFKDWYACFDKISKLEIPMRNNSKMMVLISPTSVRRIFAGLSSAFSTAIMSGIQIENYPLDIVQKLINPAIKSIKTKEAIDAS